MTDLFSCTKLLILTLLFSCSSESVEETISFETEPYDKFPALEYRNTISPDSNAIQIYSENPKYWQYKGKPILLMGASDEDNLFNHPNIWPFGLDSHLDLMKKNGGNYVRNTMSSRDHGNPWPFGKNKEGLYDLDTWNEEYWNRLDDFFKMTFEKDIIVQLEIWDRFDYAREPWSLNPFNPKNNVNYDTAESRLPELIESHPGRRKNPFFHSTPNIGSNETVLKFQEAFVKKILTYSLNYPNILYCISNETNESPKWSDYWAYFIYKKALQKDVLINVTEMYDSWDITSNGHEVIYKKTGFYNYVDVSQNNHISGQEHWDKAQLVREKHLNGNFMRPMNSVKIYGGISHGGSFKEGTERFWRNIFGGFASSRFHRTNNPVEPSGIGLTPLAQTHLKSMSMFTNEINIFEGSPANHLLSKREVNEAYVLEVPGKEYAIYFPNDGSVTIDLSGFKKQASIRWLDILNGKWNKPDTIALSSSTVLKTPLKGPQVALIKFQR